MEADAAVIASVCWQRGQGNFELAANSGYDSRGSADPRESLRKRRIGSVKKFVFLVKNGSFLVRIQI